MSLSCVGQDLLLLEFHLDKGCLPPPQQFVTVIFMGMQSYRLLQFLIIGS